MLKQKRDTQPYKLLYPTRSIWFSLSFFNPISSFCHFGIIIHSFPFWTGIWFTITIHKITFCRKEAMVTLTGKGKGGIFPKFLYLTDTWETDWERQIFHKGDRYSYSLNTFGKPTLPIHKGPVCTYISCEMRSTQKQRINAIVTICESKKFFLCPFRSLCYYIFYVSEEFLAIHQGICMDTIYYARYASFLLSY